MLDCILTDMKAWHAMGVAFESVSLNVTDGDLRSPDFAYHVSTELRRFGLSPDMLAIEVTENSIVGPNKKQYIDHLVTLRRAGCNVALDDFGTGYSSIAQIKELPVSGLKIDKSFVDDVIKNHTDQAIIQALISLGQAMDFKLIVEGVEHVAQRDFLRDMGITLAQGFLYARPMPASEVPEFIARQNLLSPGKVIDLRFG
jgi:EAL domain-containing protein (putative c-di-GMP-specific phosphodiesterase class I)